MIDLVYRAMELVIPFEWIRYDFMKCALIAVIAASPLYAFLGTMVISNRMVFFSDVLGHSALTGIAIGVLLGLADPTFSVIIFAVILAVLLNLFKEMTHASSDTLLGILFAVVVSIGVMILSRQGGFAQFAPFLIGDILAITPRQLVELFGILCVVITYWLIFGNALVLTCVNPSLARSKRVNTFLVEVSFSILLALVVSLSIKLVGVLIINSLLVLPAATARNITDNMRSYTLYAVLLSIISGILGLILSYYWGTATGATIVLIAAALYAVSVLVKGVLRRSYQQG